MRSNKVEYNTAAVLYFTTHKFKFSFYISYFSISKIIEHLLHVENNKVELVIGYDMIIGRFLMLQLGMSSDFNHQFLQWGGVTVPMKEPNGLIGKSCLTSCKMQEVVI